MREKKSAPNFASVQLSNFKHSTGLSVFYNHQMEQVSKNILMRNLIEGNILFRAGQSLGWPLQQAAQC